MKILFKSLSILLGALFLFACSSKQISAPDFSARQFDASQYEAKADNFTIIFDASSSMYEKYNGSRKFETAKTLLERMNATIPELGQIAGLRSFGHSPKVSPHPTQLFCGMKPYTTAKLKAGADKITEPGGTSPLYLALDATQTDLKGLSGQHAVIIISDGTELPGNVTASAKALKARYGDAVCFYPVLVGDDAKGAAQLKEIAAIGGCGFYTIADDILSSAGMAGFVEKVFLDKKQQKPVAKKPAPPAPKDSDGDGVYDDKDQCPGTPAGAKVNAVGCWVLENVLFDFDKSVVKINAYPLLNNVAAVLTNNPGMNVELQGHCDNVGTPEYNMDLSIRRSNAVKDYLVQKGIDANRMTTKGFGFTRPVVPNDSPEDRAMNRRVEIQPKK